MENFLPCVRKVIFAMSIIIASAANAQQSLKSILINHGSTACGNTDAEQQLFTGILGNLPSLLTNCSNGIPFYNSFTAYNPKDKKIYFADISNGNSTKMYAMDYNLTGVISCMTATTPTYTYNYGINQLCFDADGNNLVIYNYNAGAAQGAVKRIDVASGDDIPGTAKTLDFPAGNAPNSLAWGDMVFMPNGRVFMTFGNTPSKLFEMINFDGPGNATAVFLADIPRPCFSIGYVDGNLIVAGSDGGGCYYYVWDINGNSLSSDRVFPLGKSTADMTHMNVGVGASQELMGGSVINSNTADIYYHIVLKNKGNIDIANVQLKNKLTDAFGFGNVSNVHASFVSNPAGLVLNPLYDGVLFTDLLLPGQTISNYPVASDSVVIRIQLRATNLVPNRTYYSSATTSGQAGAGLNILYVKDSSNNGTADMIDVDANGVSDDTNEGIPTPFMYNLLLPVSSIGLTATESQAKVYLNWKASNEVNVKSYEAERSTDGISYMSVATLPAKNTSMANYETMDNTEKVIASKLYYRLKITDASGKYSYSNTIMLQLKNNKQTVSVYPNPFVSQVNIQAESSVRTKATMRLFDGTGKLVKQLDINLQPGSNYFSMDNLQGLSKGMYYLELDNGGHKTQTKIMK